MLQKKITNLLFDYYVNHVLVGGNFQLYIFTSLFFLICTNILTSILFKIDEQFLHDSQLNVRIIYT